MSAPPSPPAGGTTTPPAVAARSGWSLWRRPARVVRRGVLASVLAPLATAAAGLLLVLGLAVIGTNWWTGYSRDVVFSRAVQPDGSQATIATGPALEETVTILLRDTDGTLRRLVVERSAADRYVNETLRRLDRARERVQAQAAADVTALLDRAFADADLALERHADWFFAWQRSYVVLKEAAVAAASRLLSPGGYEPLQVAVERDLAAYFMRHYTAMVLQPELRAPAIERGFEAAVRHGRAAWLRVVAEEDLRLRRFLAEATRHLDEPAADQRLSTVVLDWDAQRFKAPRHLASDQAFAAALGLATVGGGSVAGAAVLGPALGGPVVQRTTRRVFAGLARRQVASMAGRLAMAQGGATAGSVVAPGGGTALGAVAGGLLGLALDYGLNEVEAARERAGFIAAHRSALDATLAHWQDQLTGALQTAIDQWFADTRAAVVLAD